MKRRTVFVLFIIVLFFQQCRPAGDFVANPVFPLADNDAIVLDTKNIIADDSVNITEYVKKYAVRGADAGPAVQPNGYWQQCGDSISIDELSAKTDFWFSFTIQNSDSLPFKRILWMGDFDYAALYCAGCKVEKAGPLVSIDEWSYAANRACFTLLLNSHEAKKFSLYYNKRNVEPGQALQFILKTEQNELSYEALEMKGRMADTVFLFFYLGFLSFCFIYFLAQFLYRRREKY